MEGMGLINSPSDSTAFEGRECPICYELLTVEDSRITACSHVFHHSCLERILNEKRVLAEATPCPYCRTTIEEESDALCVICHVPLRCESAVEISCGHVFHHDCIERHFETQCNQNEHIPFAGRELCYHCHRNVAMLEDWDEEFDLERDGWSANATLYRELGQTHVLLTTPNRQKGFAQIDTSPDADMEYEVRQLFEAVSQHPLFEVHTFPGRNEVEQRFFLMDTAPNPRLDEATMAELDNLLNDEGEFNPHSRRPLNDMPPALRTAFLTWIPRKRVANFLEPINDEGGFQSHRDALMLTLQNVSPVELGWYQEETVRGQQGEQR